MPEQDIPRLYYSIGQVSQITGIEQHVLRFWETEFRELTPRKNRAGRRVYSERDVKTVLRIKELLKGERYTIEGARRRLSDKGQRRDSGGAKGDSLKVRNRLRDIRKGLLELKELLNS